MTGTFQPHGRVDIAAIVVTYNSAHDISRLIAGLRREATQLSIRLVVVDNGSTDGTFNLVEKQSDIVAVCTGGNLGYAGGVNAAMPHVAEYEALLVLNPDLDTAPDALPRMLDCLRETGAGIVVPRIVDDSRANVVSLFNEPTVLRALGDALLGPLWLSRPRFLTEWARRPDGYETRRSVDWATGAALLISRYAADAVGQWDERFFLYSEETDYCRRVRDAGLDVVFEPLAMVRHSHGGSGRSSDLDALLAVNRVRYMRKHGGGDATVYRYVVAAGAWLRRNRSASHKVALRYLLNEERWSELPRARWLGATRSQAGSVVIPAHNEQTVIGRTLSTIADLAARGTIEVIVSCNGCTDHTADMARTFDGVTVIESRTASKSAALNEADRVASVWPRIYLDADIELPSGSIPALLRGLRESKVLAGRPPFEYDTIGASMLVKSYYRARRRIAGLSDELWGAGVYALTRAGHERVGSFPEVVADDVYVNSKFANDERRIPLCPPVRVRTPRTLGSLMAVLRRSRRGPAEQGLNTGRRTLVGLLRTVRGPVSLCDAVVYGVFAIRVRLSTASSESDVMWERDESSR